MKTWLRNILIGGLFLVPFLAFYVPDLMFFPFISGKNFEFRILIEVLFAIYLYLAISDPDYRPKRSSILYSVLLLVGAFTLATIFSENVEKSFWSNSERMAGLINWIHQLMYFVMLIGVMQSKRLWNWWWHIMLGSMTGMAIFGLIQKFDPAVVINQGGLRVDGTFGNAIYMAVFMLFGVFMALFWWWQDREEKARFNTPLLVSLLIGFNVVALFSVTRFFGLGSEIIGPTAIKIALIFDVIVAFGWMLFAKLPRWWIHIGYGLQVLLYTLALYYTATRGVTLGLIGGLLIIAIILALREGGLVRKVAGGFVVAVIVLTLIFVGIRKQDWIQENPVLNRFANISLNDSTTKTRFIIWQMGWRGFLERPLLGVGPGNFSIVFNAEYDPRLYNQETWFDRAHNEVVNWLAIGGIIGLLAYLNIFVAALKTLWRRGREYFNNYELATLVALLAAYFFQNLFAFDNLFSYILILSVLALIHTQTTTAESKPLIAGQVSGTTSVVAAGIGAIAMILMVFNFNLKPIEANRALINVMIAKYQAPTESTVEMAESIFEMDTFVSGEALEQLVMTIGAFNRTNPDAEISRQMVELAGEQIELDLAKNNLDARRHLFFGSLMRLYSTPENARTVLERALELSPKKQLIMFELASFEEDQGNIALATDYYRQAFELEPAFKAAALNYAGILIRSGDAPTAEAALVESFGHAAVLNNMLIESLVSAGNYEWVRQIWVRAVEENPENVQYILSLAASSYATNRTAEALALLNQARILAPEAASEINRIEADIRAGRPIK